MTRSLIAALLLGVATIATADDDTAWLEELKACARITEAGTRSSCYDALGRKALADEVRPEAPAQAVAAALPAASIPAAVAEAPSAPAAPAASMPVPAPSAAPAPAQTPLPSPSPAPSPKAAPVAAVAAAPAAEPAREQLPDDLGGREYSNNEDDRSDPESGRGLVTACEQDGSGRWYFQFENGQVWKQVDDDRLRFRSCNFMVTITKDIFGHKMVIDGESRRTRVTRRR